MERKESYIHTRNYGCRMRRYMLDGVEMLSMENQKIKVVLALGKGADIVELVHKKTDTDFMWHSFNPLKNTNITMTSASSGGNFLDTYAGGWQELFPAHGHPTSFRGGEIGIHGEACIYPWDCTVLEDTPECIKVVLSVRTIRSPFLLERTVMLKEEDATLYMHQKATNLGSKEQEFMWSHHPAFGFPFLDGSVRLYLPGEPTVTYTAADAYKCPFDKDTAGKWPTLPGKDGKMVDMSRAYEPEDKIYMEYGISDLAEGKFELVNHNKKLGARMLWDKEVFRYIWIWALFCGAEDYPWHGRSYVMGVEPWSSMPGGYDEAKEAGTLLQLAPGKSMETDISVELYEVEE